MMGSGTLANATSSRTARETRPARVRTKNTALVAGALALALPAAAAASDSHSDGPAPSEEAAPSGDAAPSGASLGHSASGADGPADDAPVVASPAALDPCGRESSALATGPLPVSVFEGDVGTAARACPRSELQIGPSASAVGGDRHFATMDAALRLGGSFRYASSGEAFASLEIPRYRVARGRDLRSSNLSPGWASVGAAQTVFRRAPVRIAATARFSTPAGPGLSQQPGWPAYGELGAAAAYRATGDVVVHAYAGALGGTFGGGYAGFRAAAQARAGVAWRIAPVDVLLDAGASMGYGAALDSFDLAPGLRFSIWRDIAGEAGVSLPVAGSTATDLAGTFRLTWRL